MSENYDIEIAKNAAANGRFFIALLMAANLFGYQAPNMIGVAFCVVTIGAAYVLEPIGKLSFLPAVLGFLALAATFIQF